MPAETIRIAASGLALRTRRGTVYGAVDLALPPGALALVTGACGSGRTSLLLTLAGRMRASAGQVRVCGVDLHRDPAAVRRLVGLGPIPGVTDLEDTLTAEEHVRAELALLHRPRDARAVAALLERAVFSSDASASVGGLGALDRKLLGVALGLAGDPHVLVADDLERDLTPAEADAYVRILRRLADSGVTVVASCLHADSAWPADVVVGLASAEREVA